MTQIQSNDAKDGALMAAQATSMLDAARMVQSAAEQTSSSTSREPVRQTLTTGRKPGNWGKRYPASPPSPDDMRAILDATFHPNQNLSRKLGLLGLRNRALFVLLWRSGLRIHEALLLKPDDLDFEHCTVTVRRGKGGKRRMSDVLHGDSRTLKITEAYRVAVVWNPDDCVTVYLCSTEPKIKDGWLHFHPYGWLWAAEPDGANEEEAFDRQQYMVLPPHRVREVYWPEGPSYA